MRDDFSFWLGDWGEEVKSRVSVTYTNFDSCEGLPDYETEVLRETDFSIAKLPEECPEDCMALVIDEADYGDE